MTAKFATCTLTAGWLVTFTERRATVIKDSQTELTNILELRLHAIMPPYASFKLDMSLQESMRFSSAPNTFVSDGPHCYDEATKKGRAVDSLRIRLMNPGYENVASAPADGRSLPFVDMVPCRRASGRLDKVGCHKPGT